MRAYYNEKVIDGLKYAMETAVKRILQQEDVIDAKDAIIEVQMKEIAELKKENAELKGVKSLWAEVEE